MQTLLLIDGNALMHRAFHAIPLFTTSKGFPTNVIYGFFSILQKAITDFKPSHLIVCFDTPKPTFRNDLLKEYQMQRPVIDDNFKIQIPHLKDALDKADVFHVEKDGYEADDLIGTLARKFKEKSIKVLILSGDKDILQLVNESVSVANPQGGLSSVKLYTVDEVRKKFNLEPEQIPDLKGLMGDASDNYKGAKGIGPKTAEKLLLEYKTVENTLEHIHEIKNEHIKNILETSRENILLSKKLATILQDVPVDIDAKKTKFSGWNEDLKHYLLQEFEMNGLAKKLFGENDKKQEKSKEKNDIPQMNLF